MRSFFAGALLASTSALGLIQPAQAQDTAAPAAEAPPAAAAEAGQEPDAGDIVVTAQRREQSLRDVPIAVSVISSEGLEKSNFTTIADIQFLSPGVNYNANFGGGFNVRGVGTQSLLMTAEQSVALIIDDVIQGLPEVSFAGPSYQSLGDIERIEVLKGPQGTLFGKNSSAGVIQIITKNPVLGETSVDGYVSYGTKDEINANANANFALTDTVAARISGSYQRRDGFVHNLFNGENHWAYKRFNIRGKLLWEATPDLRVLLSADYRRLSDNANGLWTLRNCGSGSGTFKPCDEVAPHGVLASPTNLDVAVEGDNFTEQTAYSFTGRVDYDLGEAATITSITAYRHLYQPILVDTDATPRPVYSHNENFSGGSQFTQELRLNGHSGILDYTLGGFYYDARPYQRGINGGTLNLLPDDSDTLVSLNSIGPYANQGYASWVKAKIKSWAIFGQLEAEVVPGLTLIAGGRYTNDDVRQTIDYYDVPWLCRTAFALGQTCHGLSLPLTSFARTKADKFTYKLTAKYDLTPDINIYATYATGYKGPMISHPANQPQLLLRPENSKSYEIGLKAALFDRKVNFNIDAFKVDYDDFQGQQRVGVAPVFYYTTTNAGGLQTKGVEADLSWRAAPGLTLAGNVAYIPTKFTEFSVQCYDLYSNPGTTPGRCNYLAPGVPAGTAFQFNAAGYPLIYSPKWTWGATVDYETPVSDNLELGVHATYNYRSSSYGIVADPNTINPGYGLVNGEISIGRDDGRWRLAVFARNLFDKYFVAGIFRTPLDAGTYNSNPLSTIGYSNIPAMDSSRTVGLKLSFAFGG